MALCRSRMQTRLPKWARRMPAASPDMPAPMMIVSYMEKGIRDRGLGIGREQDVRRCIVLCLPRIALIPLSLFLYTSFIRGSRYRTVLPMLANSGYSSSGI